MALMCTYRLRFSVARRSWFIAYESSSINRDQRTKKFSGQKHQTFVTILEPSWVNLNRTGYMKPKSRNFKVSNRTDIIHHCDASTSTLLWFYYFFNCYYFFIVVDFVIHWNETAMGLHVFPIPIPPPTSLSTRPL